MTGLHWAAGNGHYNVASSLLDWGCEVDVVNVSQYVCMASCVSQYTRHVVCMASCDGICNDCHSDEHEIVC